MLHFEYVAQATLDSYRPFVAGVAGTLRHLLLDQETIATLELLTAEACSNIIRHAYPQETPGKMRVVLSVTPLRSVYLSISDWGVGFDACPLPPEPKEGGHGLRIMNSLAPSVTTAHEGGCNTLRIHFAIPEEQWRTSTYAITIPSSLPRSAEN